MFIEIGFFCAIASYQFFKNGWIFINDDLYFQMKHFLRKNN